MKTIKKRSLGQHTNLILLILSRSSGFPYKNVHALNFINVKGHPSLDENTKS